MTQHSFFDKIPEEPSKQSSMSVPSLSRFQGALLCSTIGDALGWPTEFLDPNGRRKPTFALPLQDFVQWQKVVGGKWWGYEETIAPGSYSDDTQLALAVGRCITETGEFEPERFAYEELPLWLQYERGGGKSVKTAARKLIGKNANWLGNFYKQGELDYKTAGANGAAMRNLPIALASVNNESRIIKDSFLNAIITHGHPRAILGAIVFGLAANYALITPEIMPHDVISYLRMHMSHIGKIVTQDERIVAWIQKWEITNRTEVDSFKNAFNLAHQEAVDFLEAIPRFLKEDDKAYYNFVGALNPATKGSGLATVCAAIYLFTRYTNNPLAGLTVCINSYGSDTDTIGVFLGALLGAYHGIQAIPENLLTKIQDHDYLFKTADHLYAIATGTRRAKVSTTHQKLSRKSAYSRILAWEVGLHEMFWDDIEEEEIIFHPTLGRGKVMKKIEKPIRREGYIAKLISVQFDCGQSCTFHSRIENNEKVSDSLAQDIVNALSE